MGIRQNSCFFSSTIWRPAPTAIVRKGYFFATSSASIAKAIKSQVSWRSDDFMDRNPTRGEFVHNV
jgi:hypothetical protein